MKNQSALLATSISDPERLCQLTLQEWDLLIRQARRASLLSRIAYLAGEADCHQTLPASVIMHLSSARRVADKQAQVVRFEISCIEQALQPVKIPVVLLKGAAYVAADLPPAKGRIFSDIDIMVPKSDLEAVERYMIRHGWMTTHHDKYDQRYYRQWMHELPPMKQTRRGTVIDIHHAILPETARLHPNSEKLLANIQPVAGYENIYTLSNIDMVLHSATHLFHDGELENGLRDLVDLDALLRHFGKEQAFWDELVERAAILELGRPLYYALQYSTQILQTPVPEVVMKAAKTLGKPSAALSLLIDALFSRALMPDHASCDDKFTPLARWLLYIRSHYLRMPLHLLIPHLLRKAIKKRQAEKPLAAVAEVEKP